MYLKLILLKYKIYLNIFFKKIIYRPGHKLRVNCCVSILFGRVSFTFIIAFTVM